MQPEASANEGCTGNAQLCYMAPASLYAACCRQDMQLCWMHRGEARRGPAMAAAARLQACHYIEASLCYAVLLWVPAPAPLTVPQPLLDCHLPVGFMFWGTIENQRTCAQQTITQCCNSAVQTALCRIYAFKTMRIRPVAHLPSGARVCKKAKEQSKAAVHIYDTYKTECVGWHLKDSIVRVRVAAHTKAAALQM